MDFVELVLLVSGMSIFVKFPAKLCSTSAIEPIRGRLEKNKQIS